VQVEAKPVRITVVHRTISAVSVNIIISTLKADWIGLKEPAINRRIDPVSVVIEPKLRDILSTREHEAVSNS
jgi:hypothetical protein